MSGIAGVVHFDGAPVPPGTLEKMTHAMAHRGPDGITHWVGASAALGQCMLRTTPESRNETQPLTSDDEDLVLVMDGRVDNREDLRRDLLACGAVLRNSTDAELVLAAYATWGEKCPDRIIGEFVFFVWDARQRRLFGARDAAGARHFYYHEGHSWFGFASEIDGLLALGRIKPRVNESRLLDYLVVQFDRDDEVGTFYQGIDRMPAGHAMLAESGGARSWRYWNPGDLSVAKFGSLDECAEAFLDQLRVAVKCRLRSTGPVGAMLSGGLDSSSIVALIRNEFRAELTQPLRTYSLIRHDRESCTDWPGVKEMVNGGWIAPRIVTPATAGDTYRACLAKIGQLNEPFALSQGLSDLIVYEAASADGCHVVLDGMASDLCFYAPERSLEITLRRKNFSQVPAMLAAYRRHGIDGGLRTMARMSFRAAIPERLRSVYRKRRDRWMLAQGWPSGIPGDLRSLLDREIARQFVSSRMARRWAERPGADDNDQRIHARTFTSGMLSFAHEVNGQTALSNAVEPRSPFSDRRLIEFAIQMPLHAKLAAPRYKHLLRRSMVGILPEGVRSRWMLGGHPGWKFYERLISEMARSTPEMWNFRGVSDTLRPWIDPSSLSRAWGDYDRTPGYATGINLLTAAILAQWLAVKRHPTR